MIIYYVPCKDKKESKKIAKKLLEKKLISCANILPGDSVYTWEGEIKEGKESFLIVKTVDRHEEVVKEEIKKMHSYDLPAIIRSESRINEEYLAWMESVIK